MTEQQARPSHGWKKFEPVKSVPKEDGWHPIKRLHDDFWYQGRYWEGKWYINAIRCNDVIAFYELPEWRRE